MYSIVVSAYFSTLCYCKVGPHRLSPQALDRGGGAACAPGTCPSLLLAQIYCMVALSYCAVQPYSTMSYCKNPPRSPQPLDRNGGAAQGSVCLRIAKRTITLSDDSSYLNPLTGAEVQRVRPVSITHPEHHVNVARRRAAQEAGSGALFADQFENPANFRCEGHSKMVPFPAGMPH